MKKYWENSPNKEETRKKMSESSKKHNIGRRWWTNGKINRFCKEKPGDQFFPGCTHKIR